MANPQVLLNRQLFADVGTNTPNESEKLVGYAIPFTGTQPLALSTLNNIVLDSSTIAPIGRGVKTIYLVVGTALTWVTGGQPKVQVISSLAALNAVTGAASAYPTNQGCLAGAQANLGGASITTLAAGIYVISPQTLPELQWYHPFVGIEFTFPSALTGGIATLLMYSSSH